MLNACYPGVFDSGLGLSQSDILLIGGLVPFLSFPASPIIGNLHCYKYKLLKFKHNCITKKLGKIAL